MCQLDVFIVKDWILLFAWLWFCVFGDFIVIVSIGFAIFIIVVSLDEFHVSSCVLCVVEVVGF